MKIVLLTTSILSEESSSWLLLRQMISHMNQHEIIIFSANYLHKNLKAKQDCNVKHYRLILHCPIIKKTINKTYKKLNYYIDKYYALILSYKLNKIIKQNSIDKIWFYSDMLTVLTMSKLFEKIKISFHISIFDDMLHNKSFNHYGTALTNRYIDLLKNSTGIDVIVPEQRDYYLKIGLIKTSHPVGFTYGGGFKKSANSGFVIKKKIERICITGNIFGLESFFVFCEAIENICVTHNIKIDIYSKINKLTKNTINRKLAKYSHFVSIKPFISESQIILTISKYDLAYIQVSFDIEDKHKAITSFASKTHNYLSSTVPILIHSPAYSATSKFLEKNKLGFLIDSIEKKKIKEKFKEILDPTRRESIHNNIMEFNKKASISSHIDNVTEIISK